MLNKMKVIIKSVLKIAEVKNGRTNPSTPSFVLKPVVIKPKTEPKK
jgi:hypothetical protein